MSTGSATGSSGPGPGGHWELVGKEIIETREREADRQRDGGKKKGRGEEIWYFEA